MDSKYILTSSVAFINTDDLYHWGIKGMKWGVRRYQNPDGSLTEKGRKRYSNPDGSLNEKGKKKFGNSVKTTDSAGSKTSSGESASATKREQASDMTNSELQNRVNRLRNEDAYRDLSKKLGYDSPRTELDVKIAEMEKQKRYLELQRDIKNLTPKKVSKGQQIIDTLMKKVIEPAATEAGKKLVSQYLTEAGAQVLGKTAKKEAAKIEKTVEKSTERVKEKEAKQQAKEEPKTKAAEGTVEGVGNSSRKTSENSSGSSGNGKVIYDQDNVYKGSDGYYHYADTPITDLATSRNTSAGRSWVSGYLSSGKDDDD